MNPEVLAARYPDPPALPAWWWGWRRDRKQAGLWERVEGTKQRSKGACYQALIDLSELVNHGRAVDWQFAILAEGEKPPVATGPGELR